MAAEPIWPGRLIPDRSLRTVADGRVLVGGSPLTVLRVSRPVDPARVTAPRLVERLVDTGMAHPDPPSGPFSPAEVTVVIPVHDDPNGLAATLRGCRATLDGSSPVIVVDDASGDPEAIAAVVAADAPTGATLLRRDRNGGPGAARNTGWRQVTTPLVAFLDAGCVPGPDWLDRLLPQFADPRVALVAPRVRADPERWNDPTPGTSRAWRWLRRRIARYERERSPLDLGPGPARVAAGTRVSYVPSACIVVRTARWADTDGFDDTLRVGEDVDLVWRLGSHHRLRYVPRVTVTHDVRTRPVAWLRRRFAYGTSAAPLALRHPGGPTPVRISPWSAAAWVAVAAGRPLAGVGIAGVSVGLLVRRLAGTDDRVGLAVGLAGRGNLAAGGLLANAIRRTWWPAACVALVVGPRPLRRAVAAAFVVPPLLGWRAGRGVDPVSWLVLATADDLAYGAGVWAGCVRERTVAPLLPDLSAGRVARTSRNPPGRRGRRTRRSA